MVLELYRFNVWLCLYLVGDKRKMKMLHKYCIGCRKLDVSTDRDICMTLCWCDKYNDFVGKVFRQRKCKKQNKKVYKALLEELRR